ncbi:C40 family peptidase [Lysinibacillus endophyticus]|uniref:C40 family peptidase n=1 Tax=Ureibacillus endophyticus TaxID=1978490 RepID=UPI00209CAA25|nr:LysM peptidoglycan-binding domain-containing protein [Lysinibacillus endophyticus]MCP1143718.1 LysM peptidoglycan-binding domain-containing protein [Lysinibacillus endophyticus]
MSYNKKLLLFTSAIIATSIVTPQIAEASTYVVSKGDTLTKIAKTSNTTIDQLKEWNKLKNDTIFVGQKLVVQSSKTSKPVANTNTITESIEKDVSTYKIEKGDTLSKISKKFGVSIADLQKWNKLDSDKIFVGQVLKLNPTAQISNIGEPVKDFANEVIATTDQQINNQLSKEVPIKQAPSSNVQTIYKKVIELANTFIGTPYLYGGNTPEGFDCSGFVRYVYSNAGINIVRKSSNDYFLNDTTTVQTAVPGDLVFFKETYIAGISHMGIYLGDGVFIHAGSDGVELSKLEYEYWNSRFVTFKRFNQIASK